MKLSRNQIPYTNFPSDNAWDIPLLDDSLQADFLDLPFLQWGTRCRKQTFRGTWGFYVDDYRFSALWKNPGAVINTGCNTAVEPNFTIDNHTPRAVALYQIYRKRYLARLWQQLGGVRILADLNVPAGFERENLLGIPQGWKAYATRGYSDLLGKLDSELALAQEHANSTRVLFVVYGGGVAVKQWAEQNAAAGVLWHCEQQDKAQGRALAQPEPLDAMTAIRQLSSATVMAC